MLKCATLAGVLVLAASSGFAAEMPKGDAAKGEAVFKKCMACHRVGPEAKNAVGPVLNGVIGRKTGTAPEFSYSKLNHAVGSVDHVWTEEKIFSYLEDPNTYLKKILTDAGKPDLAVGATKMAFKLTDPADRADVIAYLKTFSPAK